MSKAGKFCLVYYYVPEDKDDPEFPNGFGLNLAVEEVKISDIRKMFPLEGEYIFRFKVKIGNSVVWMDVKEDGKIPLFNGKIIVKATRVSWERKASKNRDTSEGVRAEARSTSTPTSNANSASYQEKSYPSGNSASQSTGPNQSQSGFGAEDLNLLGGTYVSNSKPAKQNSHEDHDLLNFSHPPSTGNGYKVNQNQAASNKNDLLSFDNLF